MNRVELIGRLTKDAELRYTASDTAVSKFTLAITRQKNNDGTEETDFIPCTAFGKRAEMIGKYCKKGTQVAVEGSIRTGSYEKDDKKYYTIEVYIENITFIGTKPKEEQPEEIKIEPSKSIEQKVFEEFGNDIEYSEDDVAF